MEYADATHTLLLSANCIGNEDILALLESSYNLLLWNDNTIITDSAFLVGPSHELPVDYWVHILKPWKAKNDIEVIHVYCV